MERSGSNINGNNLVDVIAAILLRLRIKGYKLFCYCFTCVCYICVLLSSLTNSFTRRQVSSFCALSLITCHMDALVSMITLTRHYCLCLLKLQAKKYPDHYGPGILGVKSWQCPTLTWGDPTLPSALKRFTSEFEMGSGGSTSLLPPGKAF